MATKDFIWSDFDDQLGKQSDGDIQKDKDISAIFNSIRNIILTVQGQRRMLPSFACNVHGLLFEPIDDITARLIAENIVASIKLWESRIDVTGFDIEPLYDQNAYRCRLKFTIIGETEVKTINFILTR